MNTRERGQVLPLGLVLVVIGMMGALVLYNTGQVATDKMRLANSADAAAYSGALWQARALNYQAYSNRAMVANQVAIGQAVSLRSWMRYAEGAADNLATITSLVPYLNAGTQGLQNVVNAADLLVGAAADVFVGVANLITLALSVSQTAMHAATLASTEELISVVAKETDPRFRTHSNYASMQTIARATAWTLFSSQYTYRDKRETLERTQMIMASRDGFTRARNWGYSVPFVSLKRQGGTQLLAFENAQGLAWEWVAKDTLSTHIGYSGFFGDWSVETPMAWASAFANNTANTGVSITRRVCRGFSQYRATQRCEKFTEDNRRAERSADYNLRTTRGTPTLKAMRAYGGVRSFRDLSELARGSADARLTVRVEVSMPLEGVSESNDLFNGDELDNPVVAPGNTLSSISAASVFYRRPDHHSRTASTRERANAYNPYWQAQLAPTSAADRLLAVTLRNGG